jgi:co-chaperonin GroES (HSP10)
MSEAWTTIGFLPLADRVVIRPDKMPDKIGRIIVPDSVKAGMKLEVSRGEVLAMGPGMLCANGRRWPMPHVKPHERVLFFTEGGVKIKVNDEDLVSLRDDFVFAVEDP